MESSTFIASLSRAMLFGFNNLIATATTYLPRALAAVVIFTVGWLIGKWLKSLVERGIKQAKVDELIKNNSSSTMLSQVNLPFSPAGVVGSILQGVIVLVFAIVAIQTLGMVFLSQILANILAYMPRLVVASSIFVLGVVVAGWLETWLKRSFTSLEIPTARLIAKTSSYATVVIATLIALSELGIATVFIELLFAGVVLALALAFGLAVGLGSKDLIHDLIDQWYKTKKQS
jgi:small-conductance mechanosensitive channel